MLTKRNWLLATLCALSFFARAQADTLTISPASETVAINSKHTFVAKLNGNAATGLTWTVNGIAGGDSNVGTVTASGVYTAPAAIPSTNSITLTAATGTTPATSGSAKIKLRLPTPGIVNIAPLALACGNFSLTITGTNFYPGVSVKIGGLQVPSSMISSTSLSASGTATQNGSLSVQVINSGNVGSSVNSSVQVSGCSTTPPPVDTPPTDPAAISAARFLEQASFGPTPSDIASLKQIGTAAWISQQIALPATPLPNTTDLSVLRRGWYTNMATAPDQLRQRMIFALSQIFVVSADKNPYADETRPWLQTISDNAFGNFGTLLRQMTLNPAMGKYLDLGNSVTPAPNENYAREMMQLFTIGEYMLNMDGTLQLDANGNPIPTYNQARISDIAHALSGWTYPGTSKTDLNWENFTGPLQPRDAYHDKGAKTLLLGTTIPAGGSTVSDYNAVMNNIFQHPNVPPFIATRLIRALVTSNPSPAYVQRVATVFANSPTGRGDLAATVRAILLDPEARQDQPSGTQGKLKDPMLHTIGLVRVLNGKLIDPTNLFWDYFLLDEQIINAPSVFNFYSPLTRLPGSPQYFGPEFQIYSPSLAIARANLIYNMLTEAGYGTMIKIDISPFVKVAGDRNKLIDLVDATLLQGRMSLTTRQALAMAIDASSDPNQRAISALYLTAITAEFAVHK